MQIVLTVIIVTLCVVYALWRCYRVLHRPAGPCDGCAGCALKDHCTNTRRSSG